MLIVALLLAGTGGSGGGSAHPTAGAVLPAVTVSPGEATDDATVSTCAQIISALPLTLDDLQLRRTVTNPATSSVVAWGDPAIVLRCGIAKPANLTPTNAVPYVLVNGVAFLPNRETGDVTFAVVDRSVYLDVLVPHSYAQPPLGPIADAVKKVLPKAVCTTDNNAPTKQLCTRRP